VNEPRRNPVDYEGTPLTRQEYISAIVHLYRGEMSRATAWRIRLDTTTNWAVLTTAGLLAFSFRSGDRPEDHPHWVLLFGMALVTLLLGYEARRYQMFDVWRARVRKIEENFYGPILTRDPISPQAGWGERVARDLLNPSYKIGFRQAVRARFLRNYWAIYAVLLIAWLVRIMVHPNAADTWPEVQKNLAYGEIQYYVPLAYVGIMVLAFAYLVFGVPRAPDNDDPFWRGDTNASDIYIPDA
jgi:uncharacterized membrane protein